MLLPGVVVATVIMLSDCCYGGASVSCLDCDFEPSGPTACDGRFIICFLSSASSSRVLTRLCCFGWFEDIAASSWSTAPALLSLATFFFAANISAMETGAYLVVSLSSLSKNTSMSCFFCSFFRFWYSLSIYSRSSAVSSFRLAPNRSLLF